MGKRGLLISGGGGAWDAYGVGTLTKINNDYDVVITFSTGSLLAPLVALKEWDLLKDIYTRVNNKEMFDTSWYKPHPISKTGKIRIIPIIMTLLLKNKTIGTSKSLRKSIDKFFPEIYYEELKRQNKEIIVGTQNFAQVPPKIHFFSSKTEEYEEFKDWMWCGANYPFFGSLVKKSWSDSQGNFHVGKWNGSGLIDLSGVEQLLSQDFKEIDIVLHRTRIVEKLEGNHVDSLIEYVRTVINSMQYDIEFEYFYEGIRKLNRQGVKVRVFWLPRKLSENFMSYKPNEMLEWWEEGYNTAFNKERVEIFNPITSRF